MTDQILALIEELSKSGLHEGLEFCKKAAEYLAQQAIELEAEEVIGAKKYERTEARTNQRNGTRKRTLEAGCHRIESQRESSGGEPVIGHRNWCRSPWRAPYCGF